MERSLNAGVHPIVLEPRLFKKDNRDSVHMCIKHV